jgi:hypothetical protein
MTDIIYDYMPYYVCAAAFDYKGDVTPMWMSELFTWTTADVRPIEELIERLDAQPSLMLMGVTADGAVKPLRK